MHHKKTTTPKSVQHFKTTLLRHLCVSFVGSHDSLSYDLDVSSAIIEPDNLKRFSWIYCLRRIVRTWGMTQVRGVSDLPLSNLLVNVTNREWNV